MDDILNYISSDWDRLTRSMSDCSTYNDDKTNGERILYFPARVLVPAALAETLKACSVRMARLPEDLIGSGGNLTGKIKDHGLLYLENPYVVPGGQFNEMYGWDSYFIIRGLLLSGKRKLARGMIENFFYEIEHYGGVLNANRTYYLGRSQPPFLSSMILAVFQEDRATGPASLEWLTKAYTFAVKDYGQWTQAPHLAGETGLSRYFDEGEGPVPEIIGNPENYYRGVAAYFLLHEGKDSPHLVRVDAQHPPGPNMGPIFQVSPCDPGSTVPPVGDCNSSAHVGLTPEDYKGDRSMRESGFDVTFRFGPYGVETHHYAPVCLNSLLYKTEKDLEEMSRLLGRPSDARHWHELAAVRRERITKYLWNVERGLYFDYDFVTHTQSSYEYASTFYPLWSGLASAKEAQAVAKNLQLFEQAGGLTMSRYESQAQWDYPYGWAPVHLLAIEGLRRYGYHADADRITFKFLSMVLRNFRRDHTLREKYDVVSESTNTHVGIGYTQNVNGFGWTNAVFAGLLHESPKDIDVRLRRD
ncbi:MAG TPA: trehalase family glycosidase [Candidatus Acidoferrales bacterium]|nr:trehalase family glycosidase [Candidatus Acidoferrales bacterium]